MPTSNFTFIKKLWNDFPIAIMVFTVVVLFCAIGIPLMMHFKVFETKSGPPAVHKAEINVDNKPMESISLNDKETFKLNNISTVNKIKLISCKITLYKDLDYTGETEIFQHVFYAQKGNAWFIKEFDGTNNMFKSLVIEAM
jgi:flagellar basal body-associated protein FliL